MQCLSRKGDRECKNILCPLPVGGCYVLLDLKTVLYSTVHMSRRFSLFLFLFENLASEQDYIHRRKEQYENCKCKYRLYGSKRCQEHHREAEGYRGEVLIDHIIRRRSAEFTVYLTQKNYTRARRTREHSVHHKELLLVVIGEELFGNKAVLNKGDYCTDRSENKQNAPIVFKHVKSDRRNTRNDHKVKEKVAGTRHKEVVYVLLSD